MFEIAWLHFPPPNEHHADFVVQLCAEFLIPFAPEFDRTFGKGGVIFISSVCGAHGLTDIGGRRQRMRQWPRIDQYDFVTAFLKFDRSGNAINPGANNNDSRHAETPHVGARLVSSADVYVGQPLRLPMW